MAEKPHSIGHNALPDRATILFHNRLIEEATEQRRLASAKIAKARKRAEAAGIDMQDLAFIKRELQKKGDAARRLAYAQAFGLQLQLFETPADPEAKEIAYGHGYEAAFMFVPDGFNPVLEDDPDWQRGYQDGTHALALKMMKLKEQEGE